MRKRKSLVQQTVDELQHIDETHLNTNLQFEQVATAIVDEGSSSDRRLQEPHQSEINFLDDPVYNKDLSSNPGTEIRKEPTNKPPTALANTHSNNIKCHIFNNSFNSTTATQTPTNTNSNNNKKRHYVIVNDNKHNFRQNQQPNTNIDINYSLSNDIKIPNGPENIIETPKRNEELESAESIEYNKRLKSFRRNSSRKSSIAGSADTTNTTPKHSKYKPLSPTQNSEADSIVEYSKKRFSYCSSCSSSNSCNCDITGETSNTIYEGFGIGVVVSSSYTDDCGTGSCGTASLASATNGQVNASSFRGANIDEFYSLQKHGNKYHEHFDDREDNDQTANASDNCSDFDDTCSEPPSLIEDLPRVETENKILSNNLKNYSKIHEKLYNKKHQRFSNFSSNHDHDLINSDLEPNSYQLQNFFHDEKTFYHKDSLEHNIFLSYSNNSLNFKTMNFDTSNKNDGQTEVLTRTGLGANSVGGGGVGVLSGGGVGEDGEQNELNNIYGKYTKLKISCSNYPFLII